jgi:hypothetical protein
MTRMTMTRDRPLRGVRVGRALIGGCPIEIVEARTVRWLFDRTRRQFLRLPRGTALDVGVLALPWQRYAHLTLDGDGDGVVVTLDGEGLLRLHAIPDY